MIINPQFIDLNKHTVKRRLHRIDLHKRGGEHCIEIQKERRWDLVDTESCGGGIRFLAPYQIVWGYVDIYRRKEYVSGATGGPRGWRARPPASWAPRSSTDVLLPPIYTYVPPNDRGRSQKPNSTAATFCIHEIPSWDLFRSSTGGGIDHGGLLHQHHSLSIVSS